MYPSRRDFIAMTVLGGVVSTRVRGLQAHAPQNVVSGSGELGLVNGRIYTLDAANRVVNSLLIRDGRIAAVGEGTQGARRVIDLQGRTVIPGLIDNHTHFVRIGNLPGHDARGLEAAFSAAAAQKTIAARASGVPATEFITALGGLARRQF